MSNKLETVIRHAGRRLAEHQVARLFKVPEDMVGTPCDFFGYTASGRAILLEAKMVKRTSLPINVKPGLLPHQWNELLDANRANALALIAWANGGEVAIISTDQAVFFSMGRKSIPWDMIPDDYKAEFKPSLAVEMFRRWLPIGSPP